MSSTTELSPKRLGERAEAAVIEAVDALDPVADSDAEHYDAVPSTALFPSESVRMVGIAVAEAGIPIEVKTTVPRLSTGSRGRFYLRRKQHRRLSEDGGCYLLAVTTPHEREPLAMVLVAARTLNDVISSWIDGNHRADYAQIAWSRVFSEEEVNG
jgi:hypothetical protein